MGRFGLILASLVMAGAGSAQAQNVCRGAAPVAGMVIHGPVLEISDGSSLCVATGADRTDWVRIPLQQSTTTRPQLMAAAFGKNAICRIGADGRGECVVDGSPLSETLQRPEIVKAATGWH